VFTPATGCDLVVLGTIVRDSIAPYAAARKMDWTDVDFLGSAAAYDLFVAAAQGGVTEASTRWVSPTCRTATRWANRRRLGSTTQGAVQG
jgi:hypothetical protein